LNFYFWLLSSPDAHSGQEHLKSQCSFGPIIFSGSLVSSDGKVTQQPSKFYDLLVILKFEAAFE